MGNNLNRINIYCILFLKSHKGKNWDIKEWEKVPSLYNKTGILKWLCKWHIHLLKTFIPQSSGRVMMWRHLAAADVTCIVASYFIEFIKAYCPFYICITWDLGHKWKRDGLHNLYWGFKNESWDIHCFASSGCNSEREHFVILPGGQDIFSIFICNCKHLLPPSLSPSPSLAGWKKIFEPGDLWSASLFSQPAENTFTSALHSVWAHSARRCCLSVTLLTVALVIVAGLRSLSYPII